MSLSKATNPIKFSSFGGYRPFCVSWWKDLWRTMTTGWIYDVRTYWHRARYGWAPKDTCSLDHYLNGVLGGALRHLADHSYGCPFGYPHPEKHLNDDDCDESFDLWVGDLRKWATAFENASRDDYYEVHGSNYAAWHADEKARLEAVHQALKDMEPWWDALWD